jgi:ABC-type taurine transport system ATPase subunit
MSTTVLSITGLHFEHDTGHPVLRGIDLELTDSEVLVVVGPSGCGKDHAAARDRRAGPTSAGHDRAPVTGC